jgi:dihydrofolate reductase
LLQRGLGPQRAAPSLTSGATADSVGKRAKRVLRTEGTLDRVQGNARLAEAPLAEEVAAALDATDKDVQIGGAGLAAGAIELGLVDELHIFRNPVLVGGGTPLLPPVTKHVPLDLIETRTFGSRVIYERYGRARDESD